MDNISTQFIVLIENKQAANEIKKIISNDSKLKNLKATGGDNSIIEMIEIISKKYGKKLDEIKAKYKVSDDFISDVLREFQ